MYHSSALFASRRDRRVGVKACSRSNPRNEIKSGCAGLLPKLMMLLLSFVIYPVENVRLARHTRSTQRLPSPRHSGGVHQHQAEAQLAAGGRSQCAGLRTPASSIEPPSAKTEVATPPSAPASSHRATTATTSINIVVSHDCLLPPLLQREHQIPA